MEGCLCSSRPQYLQGSSSLALSLHKAKKHARFPNSISLLNTIKQASVTAMKCAGPVTELEKVLEGEEDWMEVECQEGKNLVEVLECLEKEAIMGDDKGRDPNDYNRRAHIFNKSSRVFQALKNRSRSTTTLHHQEPPTPP